MKKVKTDYKKQARIQKEISKKSLPRDNQFTSVNWTANVTNMKNNLNINYKYENQEAVIKIYDSF